MRCCHSLRQVQPDYQLSADVLTEKGVDALARHSTLLIYMLSPLLSSSIQILALASALYIPICNAHLALAIYLLLISWRLMACRSRTPQRQ